jgi:ribosomal protein L12E/L44/L45/RPP1/RPP2
MSASIDEAKLKELLKSAVVEVLEERREFVKEIVEEAIEEIALTRAIKEGLATEASSREEVFKLLDNRL